MGRIVNATISIAKSTGDTRVQHSFEILDMGEGCNCILGMDILPKLGITIENVPMKFAEENPSIAEEDHDVVDPINEVDEDDPQLP